MHINEASTEPAKIGQATKQASDKQVPGHEFGFEGGFALMVCVVGTGAGRKDFYGMEVVGDEVVGSL